MSFLITRGLKMERGAALSGCTAADGNAVSRNEARRAAPR